MYEKEIFFLFEYINNKPTIIWKYTSFNDGFDIIKDKMIVNVVYDIDYKENGIEDISSFKSKNKNN